jgi:hypothetical protein
MFKNIVRAVLTLALFCIFVRVVVQSIDGIISEDKSISYQVEERAAEIPSFTVCLGGRFDNVTDPYIDFINNPWLTVYIATDSDSGNNYL